MPAKEIWKEKWNADAEKNHISPENIEKKGISSQYSNVNMKKKTLFNFAFD